METTPPPVRRLSSRQIFDGRIVKLWEEQVVQRHGTEATYERVEIKSGASVLALDEDFTVTLVREWKYALQRETLEVVSGGMETDEDPVETARRELREEAGLVAAEWIPLGWVDPFTTMLSCRNYLFVARGLTVVPQEHEEGESIRVERMSLAEAVGKVEAGEITHGSSSVLILRAARMFGV
jgi:ADP-ribose pyrophosphatase